MVAVPVILNGVFYPKGRAAGDLPEAGVFCGYLSIEGFTGPIIPPDTTPPDPPIDVVPPDPPSGSSVAVVVKPAPATGGWGIATDGGTFKWFYTPGSAAGPKRS